MVKHYKGYPPKLSEGRDEREPLETPSHLVIEFKPDGVFLVRLTDHGKIVGDTWHATVEEAKEQATFEFGESLGEWNAA